MSRPQPLLDDEVHLLCCRLDDAALPFPTDTLSPDERARAARWLRPRDREHFVTARAWLRHTLGRYLGVEPHAIAFTHGVHGKPALAGAAVSLQFNLSHSGAFALLALSRDKAVGVDVELLRPLHDCAAIAQRHFAAAEWQRWSQLPQAQQLAAFYACWTRKEAYVKALGGGLSVPLDGFEVAFEPDRAPALLTVGGSAQAALGWTLWGVEPAPDHVAAVVVQGRSLTLRPLDAT
jgi:4'-phosphopantetheinyl transferase